MNIFYIVISIIIVFLIVLAVVFIIKKKSLTNISKELNKLEIKKNEIEGIPITAELNKLEILVKNDQIIEKQAIWVKRYNEIKKEKISKLTDHFSTIDELLELKNKKEALIELAKVDIEVFNLRRVCEDLLNEIQEITMSEEKNRTIITKLKSKFRELQSKFENSKQSYGNIANFIELQFENIEKKFQDFEIVMENNDFEEIVIIVKVLDDMIAHMDVIIDEVPDLVLLLDTIIPARTKEIKDIYEKMVNRKYPLAYLKLEYNLEEINKKTNQIIDRLKILNIEDSMFELKTFLDYLDNLFNEFELEKRSRKAFDELSKSFKAKIIKTNSIVADIYLQIEDIKGMYNLSDDDLNNLNTVHENLLEVNNKYNQVIKDIKSLEKPYSKARKDVEILSNELQKIEVNLDDCLKSLGSMHDDELRAREQLDEITDLLRKCKFKVKEYNLPIISNNYFVELAEANEAIDEIMKELEKTPIVIKTLNIRVDTARDLALKLFNTTNEIIKNAKLSEMIIVYGNRYKPLEKEINDNLEKATMLFYKGNYKQSLETSINAINVIEPDIYQKMLNIYNNE